MSGIIGLLPKVATLLLVVAFIFHLIAIGSTHWADTSQETAGRSEHVGLWKYCADPVNGGGEQCDDYVNIIYSDWLKAVQSFWILSLLTVPASIGIVAMYAFVSEFEGNMKVAGGAMAIVGISGLFTLTSVAVYGSQYQEWFNRAEPINWADQNIAYLGWSFALAVTDCVLNFVSLFLLVASVACDDSQVYYK